MCPCLHPGKAGLENLGKHVFLANAEKALGFRLSHAEFSISGTSNGYYKK